MSTSTATNVSTADPPSTRPVTVGLVADTHCTLADGCDLPDAVVDALRGCDLIVHLDRLTD